MEERDPWELESIDGQPKLEFTPKAHLVLEGSERHDWGVVKDCHGNINIITEDAEIVGTWNKYANGTIWVDLTTPLEALRDRAIQLYKELADARTESMNRLGITGPVKRAPRTVHEPKVKPEGSTLDRIKALFSS